MQADFYNENLSLFVGNQLYLIFVLYYQLPGTLQTPTELLLCVNEFCFTQFPRIKKWVQHTEALGTRVCAYL